MRHTERPKSHLDFDRVPDGAAVGRAVDRDANLVAQLRHQEPGAAEALVAVYGDRVYRLAVRITENRWDAEEVAQDALLAVIRNIDSFRGEAAFGTWMYRIAANAAYQKQRSRRHERHETSGRELVLPVDTTSEPAPLDTDWSPRLEDPALHGELRDILRVAIDALREGHRAIFLLHDVYGLSKLEIAAAFEMKVGTVKSRLHRARLFLRSRLATYLNLPETAESKASVGGALSRIDAPDRRDRGRVRQRGGAPPRYASRSWSTRPVRHLLPVRAQGQGHVLSPVCAQPDHLGAKRATILAPNMDILLPLRRFHSPHGGNGHDTPD
jgi:RNA polymerase sigma-70 factor (ECF subfamily)